MTRSSSVQSIQQVTLAWFAMVMGLCGLSLAWSRAQPWWGSWAVAVSALLGVLAAGCMMVLLCASLYKAFRFPAAWHEDRVHPVRHVFVATVPSSCVLLSTVSVTLGGPSAFAQALWCVGAASLFLVSVWVLQRGLRPGLQGNEFWIGITPALFIPVVGNVLPALAGVSLGYETWATVQYGLAAFLWPVMLVLIFVRLGVIGPWPERMLASTFITVAPPAILGLSGAQLGAPEWFMQMAWGVATFFFLWSLPVLRRCWAQPFGMAFWGLSFPLAAFAALSLRLVPFEWGGCALAGLVLVSGVILLLIWQTVKGLLNGHLLLPE